MAEAEPRLPLPRLSLVVPMRNEAASVGFMATAIAAQAGALGGFEAIFVDDGSADGTGAAIAAARRDHGFLRQLTHPRRAGQSAALHSGILAARADVVCTLDGDGQNPPAEIARLLARLDGGRFPAGIGLIAGQRIGRCDGPGKRLASAAANAIRAGLLRDGTRDTGCGLKLMRRDAFLALPYFDHMHRYLPALFARDGWGVVHVDVAHAPRHAGRSNYGTLGRAAAGAYDLIGVTWLIRRRKRARAVEETGAPQ